MRSAGQKAQTIALLFACFALQFTPPDFFFLDGRGGVIFRNRRTADVGKYDLTFSCSFPFIASSSMEMDTFKTWPVRVFFVLWQSSSRVKGYCVLVTTKVRALCSYTRYHWGNRLFATPKHWFYDFVIGKIFFGQFVAPKTKIAEICGLHYILIFYLFIGEKAREKTILSLPDLKAST